MKFSEVITVERRRAWSLEQKQAIVVESYEPGAVVSHVAARHGIRAAQVFAWRKLARAGALIAAPPGPAPASESSPMTPRCAGGSAELVLRDGLRVRVTAETDTRWIGILVRTLEAR